LDQSGGTQASLTREIEREREGNGGRSSPRGGRGAHAGEGHRSTSPTITTGEWRGESPGKLRERELERRKNGLWLGLGLEAIF
jgi:hypothetical protein